MRRVSSLLVFPVIAAALVLSVACGGDTPSGSPLGGPGRGDRGASAPSRGSGEDLAKQIEKAVKESQEASEKSGSAGPLAPGRNSARSGAQRAGGCDVNVSGDVTLSFKSPTSSGSVGSEYWFGKDELRTAMKELGKLLDPKAAGAAENAAGGDANEPWMLLILNCDSAEGGISLFPAASSGYADVPFGPKTYRIASGGLFGGARPGEFMALVTVGDDFFSLTEPGELKITKFDKTGIAGSFTLKGTEQFALGGPAKRITIQGSFDYPCDGGQNCKR